jgi:hypothetical protein
MRRILTLFSAMAVSTLFSVAGTFADDNSPNQEGTDLGSMLAPPVNECLLVAKNCVTGYSKTMERVNDLKQNISKGLNAYSPSELKAMKDELKWLEAGLAEDLRQL